MLFQENMIVILLRGKHATKKAVVLKVVDDYLLVAGIKRKSYEPKPNATPYQKRRAEKFIVFVKKVYYKHALATRYNINFPIENISPEFIVSEDLKQKKEIKDSLQAILRKEHENKNDNFLFSTFKC